MIREGGQLFRGYQLGIFVRPILESASNAFFTARHLAVVQGPGRPWVESQCIGDLRFEQHSINRSFWSRRLEEGLKCCQSSWTDHMLAMNTMHWIPSGSTHPAPITAMRIAGALSVPDISSTLLAWDIATEWCRWIRRMTCGSYQHGSHDRCCCTCMTSALHLHASPNQHITMTYTFVFLNSLPRLSPKAQRSPHNSADC